MITTNFNCPFCNYCINDKNRCSVLDRNIDQVSDPNSCQFFIADGATLKKRSRILLSFAASLIAIVTLVIWALNHYQV
jgi:hypothetical protein